jgi:hypothetical protein
MDEDEKPKTEGEPTPGEQMIGGETGTSGEEAHRIGEFDDLRDRLERIEGMLGTITETLDSMRATAAAIDIDNGADVMDGDGDGSADVIADEIEIPDYEDMDLDL